MYLLDTNICVFVIRNKSPRVTAKFRQFSTGALSVSTITVAELRYGADKSDDPARHHSLLDRFLIPLSLLNFDSDAAEAYGRIRANLEQVGTPIGANDLLIAAHSLSANLTLVTNNTREFSRVAGLKIEDWSV